MISVRFSRNFIDTFSKCSHPFWISYLSFSTSSEKPPLKTTTSFEFLLHKHHFSPKTVSEVTSVLTSLKNPQQCDSMLSYLKENGFSTYQLEKAVKLRPEFLGCSLENTIKPKIKIFQDLGCTSCDIAELFSNDPWILRRSVDCIIRSLSVLKGLLGSEYEVLKLVKSCGWFLTKDLSKNLVPNVEYLVQCGVSLKQIVRLIYSFPRFLLNDPELIRQSVEKVDKMGVDRSSKMFIYAVRVFTSMNDKTWNMKLQTFRDMGFSEDRILTVFRQSPSLFCISADKMMKIKDIVLATGKYDMSCLINRPSSFCFSIEGWYKPRFQVLGILVSKKLIADWPNFSTICVVTNIKFFEKFVAPYFEEVGYVYMTNISCAKGKLKD